MTIETMRSNEARVETISLRSRVSQWLSLEQKRLNLREIKRETMDVPVKKFAAWFETPDYVIDVAAWEQAYCVGIMVMDKRSDSMIYAVGGRCDNDAEVTARLEAFARWLSSHQSQLNATPLLPPLHEANAA